MKSFDELMAEQNEGNVNMSLGLIFREEDSTIGVMDVISKSVGQIVDEDCDYNSLADAEVEVALIKREGENTLVKPLFRVKTPTAACLYVKEHSDDPAFLQVVHSASQMVGCVKAMEELPPEVQEGIGKAMKKVDGMMKAAQLLGTPDVDPSCN